MYLWIIGAIVVLVAGMVGYALNHPMTVHAPAPVAEVLVPTATTTLALHERGSVDSIELRIDRVLEDSRCPADVVCVQQGLVRVEATVFSPNGTSTLMLALGEVGTTEVHQISLVSVTPEPSTLSPIVEDDYTFTVTAYPRSAQ